MGNEPILEFKTQAEAEECLEWWKKRLYLTDWIITVRLLTHAEMGDESGHNSFQVVNMSSAITLAILDDDSRSRIAKICHEQVLVHELLHCKYNLVVGKTTYAETYLDLMEHQLLEQMARSLIMAKYNLAPEWFINNR